MNEYQINQAQAGDEGDYLWVSLHFDSDETKNDRIHVVCSTIEDDEEDGTSSIYLERLHQRQAGPGLVKTIRVTPSSVELELTPNGLKKLEMLASLRLFWSSTTEGYQTAREHFSQMPDYDCGKIVVVEG